MAKGAQALPGFRDFFPEEFAARALILQTWRDVARRFGFLEYDGPPLEPLELYTKKSGDEIVGQLYNFVDKGGREIALRPEMTPTFARMVGSRANALRKPIRWFSIPQLFRYERQQRGRLREHFQLNVDIVGEPDVTADAELLAVAVECMRAFGLGPADVKARVSDRRLLNAYLQGIGVPEQATGGVYAVVDKLNRQPPDASAEKLREAGLAPKVVDAVLALAKGSDQEFALNAMSKVVQSDAAAKVFDDFTRYLALTKELGIGEFVEFDPSIVRGLAYYTGTVFELFDAKGELRAICGGGRYDTLLASLGGADLPALGFGMGDVVLGELLKERGLLQTSSLVLDYWVAYEDPSQQSEAIRVATILRRRGSAVEYALRPQKLGKQLQAAAAAGARAVVILRQDGTKVRKDLASGEEEPVPTTFLNG